MVLPMYFHGTDYRHLPTLTWMSGPTLPRDQVASSNASPGSAIGAGRRINPPPQLAVIDLGFFPGSGGVSRSTVTCSRRSSSGRLARTHRLVDRRHRHAAFELLDDVVPVRLDRRPGHLPQPTIPQRREPLPDPLGPLGLADRRPARPRPRRHVLADRVPRDTWPRCP
jgi:hypothetical protein